MLSNYDWNRPWECDRIHVEPPPDAVDRRSPFEHDRARIIHSVAFRRLQGKTQIFAPAQAEFLRTRVTHSIEVSQIGRSIAAIVGVPGELVEAACLAHDLGHPPFGHTGEAILNELMTNYGGFEGNAQTFRILTRLEEKSRAYPGLNLCRATLLGTIKYPFRRYPGQPKFLYDDDAEAYGDWLFAGTNFHLVDEKGGQPRQSIICQLMDWADDVAYSVHDMEDGLQSGFLLPSLPFNEIVDWVWRRIERQMNPVPDRLTRDRVDEILKELKERLDNPQTTIREVTRYYINRFVTSIAIELQGSPDSLFHYRLQIPEAVRHECLVFKMLTLEFIILDERTTTLAFKGREILTRLFEALLANTSRSAKSSRFELFPRSFRERLECVEADESLLARWVCDRLASMTDGQAIRLYNRLFESSGSSPFEPV